jgi:hypothetical protein
MAARTSASAIDDASMSQRCKVPSFCARVSTRPSRPCRNPARFLRISASCSRGSTVKSNWPRYTPFVWMSARSCALRFTTPAGTVMFTELTMISRLMASGRLFASMYCTTPASPLLPETRYVWSE